MSSASRPISIQATLPLPPVAEEKERVVVDLEKDTHGLGFTVAGIENTPDGVCSSSPGCLFYLIILTNRARDQLVYLLTEFTRMDRPIWTGASSLVIKSPKWMGKH